MTSTRKRRRVLALVGVCGLIGVNSLVSGRAGAQTAGPEPEEPLVRVILELPVDYEPPAQLSAAGERRQEATIDDRQANLRAAVGPEDGQLVTEFETIPYAVAELTPTAIAALEASGAVESVAEDRLLEPTLDDSIPLIGANDVWAAGFEGDDKVIAILDTGVDNGHGFLNVVHEACFADNSSGPGGDCPNGQTTDFAFPGSAVPCPQADCDHGTHVAGIATADDPPPGVEFDGVARLADVMAIQVFHDVGGGQSAAFFSDVTLGLEHVFSERNNFDIGAVNLSLGGFNHSSVCDGFDGGATKTIVDSLRGAGIATVAASGNGGSATQILFPSCVSSVVSVGNTTKSDAVNSGSQAAPFLDLLATGTSITSSVPGGGTASFTGTSMSAPHVSGAFTLLHEENPDGVGVGQVVSDSLARLKGTGTCIYDSRNGEDFFRINVDLARLSGTAGGFNLIEGTAGNDTLTGTAGPDIIHGLGGNDTIKGKGGGDIICGGSGKDTINGGPGDDMIFGGSGNDLINGDGGIDEVLGGAGADNVAGGAREDIVNGNAGADTMRGGTHMDTMRGGAGGDFMVGARGDDTVSGNTGGDEVRGGTGADTLDGGPGTDFGSGGPGIDTCTAFESQQLCE